MEIKEISPFKCVNCNLNLDTIDEVVEHMLEEHGIDPTKVEGTWVGKEHIDFNDSYCNTHQWQFPDLTGNCDGIYLETSEWSGRGDKADSLYIKHHSTFKAKEERLLHLVYNKEAVREKMHRANEACLAEYRKKVRRKAMTWVIAVALLVSVIIVFVILYN